MLSIARLLFIFGIVFLVLGGVLYLVARTGVPLGRLPGDIRFQGENFTCVFALGTSLILSIVLTLIFNLILRVLNK